MSLIGIDLGTTNSLIAHWGEQGVEIIPNRLGARLTPSAVSLDADGAVIVGQAAKDRLVTHPDLSVASFKRRMGTNAAYTLGKQSFRPEELSALVLKQLKEDAEAYLNAPVTEAVISVPAYFNDNQRSATKRAAELAGLKVERLINEPTAAAVAYGLHDRAEDCHYLIIDLGGGTFDVSVLEFFDGVMEVHASAGDNYLGGDDFSEMLVNDFCKTHNLNIKKLSGQEVNRIESAMDRIKHRLTREEAADAVIQINGKELSYRITRAQFEDLAAPLLHRLRKPIERALRDSKLTPSDINEVILVGGATRMPVIRSLVSRILRRFPLSHLNPDEVVCHGAAVQAALKNKHQALDDVVLTDVAPYTLGISISMAVERGQYENGHFLPIIERNSVVPISRMEVVNTLQDKQTQLEVEIYQGESRLVKNNILLGNLMVKVPPKKAGEEAVQVRFTYDVNGILEVLVKVMSTGEEYRAVIENSPGQMSEKEIEASLEKLAALKVHPRDQAQNIALLARAERLYEESLGDLRHTVADLVRQFERALDTQDHKHAEEAREQLENILTRIEEEVNPL
ncbi:Molecular chaperone [Hahella chejuensis KCTC 2396]|uniref:Molecular chaperone n=1 Tax=Hahella chejuensis (strain KCTC 2396) TaxID=349521 RepID=Q2SAX1_HAHCH|nr:molecular chaperone HscC [Hahella chejuensis]ABC32203.1 Molecular chaperone [Hahella chejuensis KCTC 2396]